MLAIETRVDLNSQTASVNRARHLKRLSEVRTSASALRPAKKRMNRPHSFGVAMDVMTGPALSVWCWSLIAFIQSYAYYKNTQTKPGEQPPAPVR